jgi:hypothetical protein
MGYFWDNKEERWRTRWRRVSSPPKPLPDWLRAKLSSIPHTFCPWKELYFHPVAAQLRDGSIEERVTVFSEEGLLGLGGGHMLRNRKNLVDISNVRDVFASPSQMPPKIAFKLYQTDETRMGGCDFSLRMKDGTRIQYVYGQVGKDFVLLPGQYEVDDIQSFRIGGQHEHAKGTLLGKAPDFKWCLYNEDERILKGIDWTTYPYPSPESFSENEQDKYFPVEPNRFTDETKSPSEADGG